MAKTYYMHTLDGQPASFDRNHGGYIHFVKNGAKVKLENDLKTIRRQQEHDIECAPPNRPNFEYGYVRVGGK